MAEWLKDPITFQAMLWSFVLYSVMVVVGGIGASHSPRGIVTGVVVSALSAAAMLLGLGFTRLWFGLFWRNDPLRSTRAAAVCTGAIFIVIGLRFMLEGIGPQTH